MKVNHYIRRVFLRGGITDMTIAEVKFAFLPVLLNNGVYVFLGHYLRRWSVIGDKITFTRELVASDSDAKDITVFGTASYTVGFTLYNKAHTEDVVAVDGHDAKKQIEHKYIGATDIYLTIRR